MDTVPITASLNDESGREFEREGIEREREKNEKKAKGRERIN